MRHLWISEAAFMRMVKVADSAFPLETGGVLAGYFADSGEPVVFDVIGPGPKASHLKKRFHPDHAWQCSQLDSIFKQSSETWVYLGDWHTHPNGSSQMSWLDQRTLHKIANYNGAETPHPLMLIGSGSTQAWNWTGYQYQNARMLGVPG